MKQIKAINMVITGLALFFVLFEASTILLPLELWKRIGNKTFLTLGGFFISGIGLPFLGFMGATLFDGDYKSFFYRLGTIPGTILIFFCMLALGPLIAIPRVLMVAHEITRSFFPALPAYALPSALLSIAFIGCMRGDRVLLSLSAGMYPLLLVCVLLFMSIALITPSGPASSLMTATTIQSMHDTFIIGYKLLDLMGVFFCASLIVSLLTVNTAHKSKENTYAESGKNHENLMRHTLIMVSLCLVGVGLMHYLATLPTTYFFTPALSHFFQSYGMILGAGIVLLACILTIIGLSTIVARYLTIDVCGGTITYGTALTIVFISSLIAFYSESKILLAFVDPLMKIAYPTIITLVLCNILYKVFGFEHVRLPTFIVFATVILHYIHKFIAY